MTCGEPLPGDPSWTCQREIDHPRDWHRIFLFSGSVDWLVEEKAREIDEQLAAKYWTKNHGMASPR